jgi:plastocyanin
MKRIFLTALCLILFIDINISISQEPVKISGTVFMPVLSKSRRTFRGRIYRNRLSSAKKKKRISQALKSSFTDIIVSAHPLSYEFEIDSMPPVKILQTNAEFFPRVVPLIPGTEVQFVNRDNFFHNVFSISPGSRFNIGRNPTGIISRRRIEKLGETKLFCDIHAQMNATVICLNTPYFTRVNAGGQYILSDLPEGTYEIQVYHPDLPIIRETVAVENGQTIIKNYTLTR